MSDRPLTGKQKKFVSEYAICLNGTEAARRAGYTGDDATLAVTASRLLRNAKVMAAYDELLKESAMSAAEVLMHLTDIARGDLADSLNSMGGIDPLEAKRRGKAHLLKRLKIKTTYVPGKSDEGDTEIHETEVEMYDRLRALELLGKAHRLFVDRQEITGKDGAPLIQVYLPVPDDHDSA